MYIASKSKKAFLAKCAELGVHPQLTCHLHSFAQIEKLNPASLQIAVAHDWEELPDFKLKEYLKFKGLV